MLTSNTNIENRLICEQMATVKHIEIRDKEVQTIFLELDDQCAGELTLNAW